MKVELAGVRPTGHLVIKFSESYRLDAPTEPTRRWTIKTTADVRQGLRSLRQADPETYRSVNVALDMPADGGSPRGQGEPCAFSVIRPTKVVYGIALGSGAPLTTKTLFIFAQVALYRAVRRLRSDDIDVEVIGIPDC